MPFRRLNAIRRSQLPEPEYRAYMAALAEHEANPPPPATVAKQPSKATCKKYGLTVQEWNDILDRQVGVCSICKRLPPSGILCVDHQHVRGFKKMPPEQRKRFVRTLACAFCNRRLLAKGITTERARNILAVLEAFDERLAATKPAND